MSDPENSPFENSKPNEEVAAAKGEELALGTKKKNNDEDELLSDGVKGFVENTELQVSGTSQSFGNDIGAVPADNPAPTVDKRSRLAALKDELLMLAKRKKKEVGDQNSSVGAEVFTSGVDLKMGVPSQSFGDGSEAVSDDCYYFYDDIVATVDEEDDIASSVATIITVPCIHPEGNTPSSVATSPPIESSLTTKLVTNQTKLRHNHNDGPAPTVDEEDSTSPPVATVTVPHIYPEGTAPPSAGAIPPTDSPPATKLVTTQAKPLLCHSNSDLAVDEEDGTAPHVTTESTVPCINTEGTTPPHVAASPLPDSSLATELVPTRSKLMSTQLEKKADDASSQAKLIATQSIEEASCAENVVIQHGLPVHSKKNANAPKKKHKDKNNELAKLKNSREVKLATSAKSMEKSAEKNKAATADKKVRDDSNSQILLDVAAKSRLDAAAAKTRAVKDLKLALARADQAQSDEDAVNKRCATSSKRSLENRTCDAAVAKARAMMELRQALAKAEQAQINQDQSEANWQLALSRADKAQVNVNGEGGDNVRIHHKCPAIPSKHSQVNRDGVGDDNVRDNSKRSTMLSKQSLVNEDGDDDDNLRTYHKHSSMPPKRSYKFSLKKNRIGLLKGLFKKAKPRKELRWLDAHELRSLEAQESRGDFATREDWSQEEDYERDGMCNDQSKIDTAEESHSTPESAKTWPQRRQSRQDPRTPDTDFPCIWSCDDDNTTDSLVEAQESCGEFITREDWRGRERRAREGMYGGQPSIANVGSCSTSKDAMTWPQQRQSQRNHIGTAKIHCPCVWSCVDDKTTDSHGQSVGLCSWWECIAGDADERWATNDGSNSLFDSANSLVIEFYSM